MIEEIDEKGNQGVVRNQGRSRSGSRHNGSWVDGGSVFDDETGLGHSRLSKRLSGLNDSNDLNQDHDKMVVGVEAAAVGSGRRQLCGVTFMRRV